MPIVKIPRPNCLHPRPFNTRTKKSSSGHGWLRLNPPYVPACLSSCLRDLVMVFFRNVAHGYKDGHTHNRASRAPVGVKKTLLFTCDSEVHVHHRPEEAGVPVNDQHHLTRIPSLPLGHRDTSETSIEGSRDESEASIYVK